MEPDPKGMNDYPHSAQAGTGSLPTDLNVPSFHNTGDVVGAVFQLYRDNFLSLLKIVVVLAVPLIVAQHIFLKLSRVPLAEVTIYVSAIVGESLMSGALIYAVVTFLRTGAFPTLADSYTWGRKRWGRVLFCSFLYMLVVVAGCMALIVPGIIFSLMFALVVPVAVLEDKPASDSFSRSRDLTRNYRLQIFLTYFVFSLLIFVISLVTNAGFGGEPEDEISLPFALVQGLITQLLESSSTVLTLFIYLGILRDTSQLSTQFPNAPPPPPPGDDPARASQVETGREF
ncbi:MAG TPA: hypothetical protein VGB76_07620 [Pyrinomonadaceae bacterium]|jgi:hypothetical protein